MSTEPLSLQDAINRALYGIPAGQGVTYIHTFVRNFLSKHYSIARNRMTDAKSAEEAQEIFKDYWEAVSGGAQ